MAAGLLLALSFAIVLAGALLFTNAVEWAGHKLELGEGEIVWLRPSELPAVNAATTHQAPRSVA